MPRKDSGEPVWGQGELDLGRVPVGRAKICPLPESELGLTANAPGSGVNTSEPFAHFDHGSSSWKTYQVCLLTNTWDVFSETWPKAGTMRNGIVCQQVPLVPLTYASESSFVPTPSGDMAKTESLKIASLIKRGDTHAWGNLAEWLAQKHGLRQCPSMLEAMMGYPIAWSDCRA